VEELLLNEDIYYTLSDIDYNVNEEAKTKVTIKRFENERYFKVYRWASFSFPAIRTNYRCNGGNKPPPHKYTYKLPVKCKTVNNILPPNRMDSRDRVILSHRRKTIIYDRLQYIISEYFDNEDKLLYIYFKIFHNYINVSEEDGVYFKYIILKLILSICRIISFILFTIILMFLDKLLKTILFFIVFNKSVLAIRSQNINKLIDALKVNFFTMCFLFF